jgi:hypothetical protein
MSQIDNGQSRLDQLPYYREYLEQILKPRVMRLIEDLRSNLTERVWDDLITRMASEQAPGAPSDPAVTDSIRATLRDALRLQLATQIVADFDGSPAATPVPSPAPQPGRAEVRENVSVVERTFPNNPLARAVGGVRRSS